MRRPLTESEKATVKVVKWCIILGIVASLFGSVVVRYTVNSRRFPDAPWWTHFFP